MLGPMLFNLQTLKVTHQIIACNSNVQMIYADNYTIYWHSKVDDIDCCFQEISFLRNMLCTIHYKESVPF